MNSVLIPSNTSSANKKLHSKKHSPLSERRTFSSELTVNLSLDRTAIASRANPKKTFHMSQYYTREEIEEIYFDWLATTEYIKLYED